MVRPLGIDDSGREPFTYIPTYITPASSALTGTNLDPDVGSAAYVGVRNLWNRRACATRAADSGMLVAGRAGLEPTFTGPKPAVLPLDDRPTTGTPNMVGAAGFEPATPCPPDKCANQAAPRSATLVRAGYTEEGRRQDEVPRSAASAGRESSSGYRAPKPDSRGTHGSARASTHAHIGTVRPRRVFPVSGRSQRSVACSHSWERGISVRQTS